jgi:sugar phosphate permease
MRVVVLVLEHRRSRAHFSSACRYACFYITRTCFNYVNPVMLKDAGIGVDLTVVGFISSLLPIAYAFSKGISGFLGSTMSPRLLLSMGLASTGLACAAFGFGNSVPWFATFWSLNGLLQVSWYPAPHANMIKLLIHTTKHLTVLAAYQLAVTQFCALSCFHLLRRGWERQLVLSC